MEAPGSIPSPCGQCALRRRTCYGCIWGVSHIRVGALGKKGCAADWHEWWHRDFSSNDVAEKGIELLRFMFI